MSLKSPRRLWMGISALLLAHAGFAQAFEQFIDQSDQIAPYRAGVDILGVQPGMTATEAKAILEAHYGKDMAFEDAVYRATSPDGHVAQYQMNLRLFSPWVTPMIRMSHATYEEITLTLTSAALGERVIAIDRTIVAAPNERPAPAAVYKQITDAFGAPSIAAKTGEAAYYFWDAAGFIGDYADYSLAFKDNYDAKGESIHHRALEGIDTPSFHVATPCLITRPVGFANATDTEPDDLGTCSASFTVIMRHGDLHFQLIDHNLNRLNNAITNQQVEDALKREVAPSGLAL